MTSAVAWLALVLALIALTTQLLSGRRARRARERSLWDDEQLLRTAWLQEIEARGQALLEQFVAAEQRLSKQHASLDATEPTSSIAGVDPRTAAPTEITSAEPTSGVPDATAKAPESDFTELASGMPTDDFVARVQRLADEGNDVAAIARRLNVGGGEIELILGLRAAKTRAD